MSDYFNQSAYMRWLRSYYQSLSNYTSHIENIRDRLNNASDAQVNSNPELRTEIERDLDRIEEKIDLAMPRNFNNDATPLTSGERFSENMKLLIDLLFGIFNRSQPFKGIYQKERERVQHIHHEFNFKDHLNEVKHKMDTLLNPAALSTNETNETLRKTEQA